MKLIDGEGRLLPAVLSKMTFFCYDQSVPSGPYSYAGFTNTGSTDYLAVYEDGFYCRRRAPCHRSIDGLVRNRMGALQPQGKLLALSQPFRYWSDTTPKYGTPFIDLSPYYYYITGKNSPWKQLLGKRKEIHFCEISGLYGRKPVGISFYDLSVSCLLLSNFLIASRKASNYPYVFRFLQTGWKTKLDPSIVLYLTGFASLQNERVYIGDYVAGLSWFFETAARNRTSGHADVFRLMYGKPNLAGDGPFNELGGQVNCNHIWSITDGNVPFIDFLRPRFQSTALPNTYLLPDAFWKLVEESWGAYMEKHGRKPEDIK